MENDVDLTMISNSSMAQGFSGADLATLVKEAGLMSILKDLIKIG